MLRQINNINNTKTANICSTLSISQFRSYRVTLTPQPSLMDLQLSGKTALILAASKGLGKACAAALAAEGADVVIGARNATTLEKTAQELRALGKGRVMAVPVDVKDPAQAADIVTAAGTAFGKIDILVNNAGGPPFG